MTYAMRSAELLRSGTAHSGRCAVGATHFGMSKQHSAVGTPLAVRLGRLSCRSELSDDVCYGIDLRIADYLRINTGA